MLGITSPGEQSDVLFTEVTELQLSQPDVLFLKILKSKSLPVSLNDGKYQVQKKELIELFFFFF